tara:strand:+ start:5342 stop:5977 length:636 start_codon:yes stop_codon:yes gene_type:complete
VIKEFTFDLDDRLINQFFKPIRRKEDVIILTMNVIQFIGISSCIPIKEVAGKMVLRISKMNRIFFYSNEKYFSISFPYNIEENNDGFKVFSPNAGEVSRVTISKVKSIFSDENIMSNGCISLLADNVLDESLSTPSFWVVLRELLLMEDGYLRYDHDTDRENGHFHPVNHLDIFYSNKAGFKVGLDSKLLENELIEIMDYESECRYLQKPT